MKLIILLILMSAVFITALQCVMSQHESRKLFVEIQKLEKERDVLNEEWGRLQLEQSTWSTDGRIEETARDVLHMKTPDLNSKVVVTR